MCDRRRPDTFAPMADPKDVTEPGEIRDLTLDHTRGLRYAELFFVGPEWITVYNSMGLSEAPAELWEALDAEATAKRFGQQAVIKNGPHWWASDELTLRFGVDQIEVGGIGFRFAARLPASLAKSGKLQPPFYTVVEAEKEGSLSYASGEPVYELVSPDGDEFVMQSMNVEPGELESLGERLSPTEGWQFRIRPLEEDLTVSLDGKVRTVMDDLRNVYNGAAVQG